jgi:anthranilate synthase component 2
MSQTEVWVLDNYDSFTYNLVHYVQASLPHAALHVVRNDEPDTQQVLNGTHLVISPGPGLPEEAGQLMPILRRLLQMRRPPLTLGVCLGMQAMAVAAGGTLYNLPRVYHGEASEITIIDPENPLFQGLPQPLQVGRYHSWAVKNPGKDFQFSAFSPDGAPMAMRHCTLPIFGVQFHPESILTPQGLHMIEQWAHLR